MWFLMRWFMAREFELSLNGVREGIKEEFVKLVEEKRQEIERESKDTLKKAKEKIATGKIPIEVGYKDTLFYLGIFCNKNCITDEQIKRLEKINKKIIKMINSISTKCDKLACTYNALKKSLPELSDEDINRIEEIQKEIVDNSTANYILTSKLDMELKQTYQLLKGVKENLEHCVNQDYSILYDFKATESVYRKLHFIYRCYKVIEEWQNVKLTVYMGRGNQYDLTFVTEEKMDFIRNKIYDFEVKSKIFHTSELVEIVNNADKTGTVDEVLLTKIEHTIEEL